MSLALKEKPATLVLRPGSWHELEAHPDFPRLVEEYAAESAVDGMPVPQVDAVEYRAREATGAQATFLAFYGEQLIGFLIAFTQKLRHYGVQALVVDAFFVTPDLRSTGAGLRLLRAAEKLADAAHCCGTIAIAPLEGSLVEVLPRVGYAETNRVFFKKTLAQRNKSKTALALSILPPSSDKAIATVRKLEHLLSLEKQVNLPLHNALHAGIYSRTIFVPAGVVVVGALIKIPTLLTVSGEALAYIGEEAHELRGYNVLAAAAHRKQVVFAKTDLIVTMSFATTAKTIEEAEEQFTDEAHLLQSRQESFKEWQKMGNILV